MARVIILPKLGQTMEQGTIVEWLVKEGDAINRGDILFNVESDKAVLEAESRYRGTLLKILVGPDVEVPVLAPVAIIGDPGEDISALLQEIQGGVAPAAVAESAAEPEDAAPEVAQEPAPSIATGRVIASPRARKLAGERGVPLESLSGTGPEGRIIEADVIAYLDRRPPATPLAQRLASQQGIALDGLASEGERVTAAAVRAASTPAAAAHAVAPATPDSITPMRGVRAIIAERMGRSAHTTAAITLHSEADATAFVAMRESLRDALKVELGFSVGYNDLLAVIVARCLVEFPYMNVQLTEQGIRQMPEVNIGLAVDSERGLLVPVLRQANLLGIRDFARRFRELVEKARTGRASPDDLSGGTFTITNLGMYGVDMFTPIINLPECAILGVGRIRSVPAIVDGQVAVRQSMWLSLTVDHRLVDGAPAARFLQGIVRYIEAPYLLLT